MPKQKKGHATPHVCVPVTNPRRYIPSDHDQQDRYRLQHSVLDSFHSEIGPDAKLDMLRTFYLDKLFDLHLDPLCSDNLPLCRITQDGKDPITTTDFYLSLGIETKEGRCASQSSNYFKQVLQGYRLSKCGEM